MKPLTHDIMSHLLKSKVIIINKTITKNDRIDKPKNIENAIVEAIRIFSLYSLIENKYASQKTTTEAVIYELNIVNVMRTK